MVQYRSNKRDASALLKMNQKFKILLSMSLENFTFFNALHTVY
jgi:hypothetical protein